MKVRRNDTVLVVAGKGLGKKGKVHRVYLDEGRVLVEGVNLVKRHTRARPGVKQAGIVEKEAPVHISNVMLFCAKCNHPARVGFRFLEDGSKVRICRTCGEVIES